MMSSIIFIVKKHFPVSACAWARPPTNVRPHRRRHSSFFWLQNLLLLLLLLLLQLRLLLLRLRLSLAKDFLCRCRWCLLLLLSSLSSSLISPRHCANIHAAGRMLEEIREGLRQEGRKFQGTTMLNDSNDTCHPACHPRHLATSNHPQPSTPTTPARLAAIEAQRKKLFLLQANARLWGDVNEVYANEIRKITNCFSRPKSRGENYNNKRQTANVVDDVHGFLSISLPIYGHKQCSSA